LGDLHGRHDVNLVGPGALDKSLGTGSVLSASSQRRQIAPDTAGLGPLTKKFYYGLGVAVGNHWIIGGAPGLEGFSGAVAYLPEKKLSVVIFTTAKAKAPSGVEFAPAIWKRVGALLAPSYPPRSSASAHRRRRAMLQQQRCKSMRRHEAVGGVAHPPHNPKIAGSNPALRSIAD
jgi:hypothetical protein